MKIYRNHSYYESCSQVLLYSSIIENLINRKIKIKAIQGRFEELSSLCRECSTRKKLIKFNLFQKFEHVKCWNKINESFWFVLCTTMWISLHVRRTSTKSPYQIPDNSYRRFRADIFSAFWISSNTRPWEPENMRNCRLWQIGRLGVNETFFIDLIFQSRLKFQENR